MSFSNLFFSLWRIQCWFYKMEGLKSLSLWKSKVQGLQFSIFFSYLCYSLIIDFFLCRVPMYYHVKFAFLVWLQLPSTDVNFSNAYILGYSMLLELNCLLWLNALIYISCSPFILLSVYFHVKCFSELSETLELCK